MGDRQGQNYPRTINLREQRQDDYAQIKGDRSPYSIAPGSRMGKKMSNSSTMSDASDGSNLSNVSDISNFSFSEDYDAEGGGGKTAYHSDGRPYTQEELAEKLRKIEKKARKQEKKLMKKQEKMLAEGQDPAAVAGYIEAKRENVK